MKTLEIKLDSVAVEAEKKQDKVDVEGILYKCHFYSCIILLLSNYK